MKFMSPKTTPKAVLYDSKLAENTIETEDALNDTERLKKITPGIRDC
jgi:hypothetical protein